MSLTDAAAGPNVAAVLAQVLKDVPLEQQPLLIAIAERMAAERYRDWAREAGMQAHSAALRACADREEQIAGRIEALYPDAVATQNALRVQYPNLTEINRALFAGRALTQQFTTQAQGERLGAATWKAFARHASDEARRAAFLACADLEEESARALDAILDATRPGKSI